MRMILLAALMLPGTALAQDTFDPVPSTAEIDGETVSGILIDEQTAEELFLLRSEVGALKLELDATEKRLEQQIDIEKMTADALRAHHDREMQSMQTYYMGLLEESSGRTFREKHGFDVGIAVGVLGTVAAIAVTGYALGQTSSL